MWIIAACTMCGCGEREILWIVITIKIFSQYRSPLQVNLFYVCDINIFILPQTADEAVGG
jgi:hypothetical protein